MSPPPVVRLVATVLTHPGAVRAVNEDTIALGDRVISAPMTAPETVELEITRPLICLIADGMGGHAAGGVASRAVAERLTQQASRADGEAAVAGLLAEANELLYELMRARPGLRGMGTTVAGVVLAPAGSLVFNVGDSRVYRIEAGRLEQLSTDDTPGPKLADGRTAALTSHLITQTLGGAYEPTPIEPHLLALSPLARERYLICSDGLSDLVPLGALEAGLGADDRASIAALFEAAIAAGGTDNISIVMLDLRRG